MGEHAILPTQRGQQFRTGFMICDAFTARFACYARDTSLRITSPSGMDLFSFYNITERNILLPLKN